MIRTGAYQREGTLQDELFKPVLDVLLQLEEMVESTAESKGFRMAQVRSLLDGTSLIIVDARHIFWAGQTHHGMSGIIALDEGGKEWTLEQVADAGRWDFGLEDPFVISIPRSFLELTAEERKPGLEAIAKAHVESETRRVERSLRHIPISPIFGPAEYAVDPRLCFVLMPFRPELDRVYESIIKPTVEREDFGLVCRRADEIRSNKAIIQDIWKEICEARVVIADLTGLNPNVMYELGVVHTVGKETILIFQVDPQNRISFPFDLTHIRRIEYVNDASGGKSLENQLRETLQAILGRPS